MSPRGGPPNVDALPHDLADFTVSVTLAPTFDDDRAAQLSGTLSEGAARWLVAHLDELHAHLTRYAGLDDEERDALAVLLGPKQIADEARQQLELESLVP